MNCLTRHIKKVGFLVLVLILACKPPSEETIFGKYTTYQLKGVELIKYKVRYNRITSRGCQTLMMLSLFRDSSFVISGCNNLVNKVGKYSLRNDSLYFINVYSYSSMRSVDLSPIFFDKKRHEFIHFDNFRKNLSDTVNFCESLTVLRKNGTYDGQVHDTINGYLMNKSY